MWAHRYDDAEMLVHASHDKGWVEMHNIDDPIVKVLVEESPEGEYYGWLEHGEVFPCMIWKGKNLFDVCFPYGPEEEVKKGKGEVLQLTLTEIK